jgi:hypothetical protein
MNRFSFAVSILLVGVASAAHGQSSGSGGGFSGGQGLARPGIQAGDLGRSIGANRASVGAMRADPSWSQTRPGTVTHPRANLDERSPLFSSGAVTGADQATIPAGRPLWSNGFRGLPSSDVSRQTLEQFRGRSDSVDWRDAKEGQAEGREPEAILQGPYADPDRPELRVVNHAQLWWQTGGGRLASGTARAVSEPMQSTANNPIFRRSPAEVRMDQRFNAPPPQESVLEARSTDR